MITRVDCVGGSKERSRGCCGGAVSFATRTDLVGFVEKSALGIKASSQARAVAPILVPLLVKEFKVFFKRRHNGQRMDDLGRDDVVLAVDHALVLLGGLARQAANFVPRRFRAVVGTLIGGT